MKFAAFLTYNNNTASLSNLGLSEFVVPANSRYAGTSIDLRCHYNEQNGLVIFSLRNADFAGKMGYYTQLQKNLQTAFGKGFDLAIAADSDSSDSREMLAFCKEMKAGNPATTTILTGSPALVTPKELRMAHNPDPGHIDFYEESDVLSARDKFQDNAGLPTLPEGVDYFANSLYSRAAFRTLLLDKAANASFALTPEIKTKITTAVTQAFAVSDEASSAAPAKFKGLGQ